MKRRLLMICCVVGLFFCISAKAIAAGSVTLWFPPEWKTKADQAKKITDALSKGSGVQINPRLATSYPAIIEAFSGSGEEILYGGSFVSAIIVSRDLGTPLVQGENGKELYSGVMVYPKGQNAESILKETPDQIAFAVGASSGESSAKASTNGKAAVATPNHGASCGAVKSGKAKAAFVKNWWWEENKQNFVDFDVYKVPGVSEEKNPDNVLLASKEVTPDVAQKVAEAAKASQEAFGVKSVVDFDPAKINFSIDLMKKGGIDPQTYKW